MGRQYQFRAAMPLQQLRAAVLLQQLRAAVMVQQLRAAVPIQQLRSAVPIQQLRSAVPIQQLRAAVTEDLSKVARITSQFSRIGRIKLEAQQLSGALSSSTAQVLVQHS